MARVLAAIPTFGMMVLLEWRSGSHRSGSSGVGLSERLSSSHRRSSWRSGSASQAKSDLQEPDMTSKVLYLCTGNSCRSQMAEGWTRQLRPDWEPHSAGTHPGRLDVHAVRVMAEVGVDISRQHSKHVDELAGLRPDLVITVCDAAREACPTWPTAAKMQHVGFDDPPRLAAEARSDEEVLAHYRRVRDEIRAFVESLPPGRHGEEP